MKTPTIKQFNRWDKKRKTKYISDEVNGNFSDSTAPGFLFYENQNVSIRYRLDRTGNLLEAEAFNFKQGFSLFKRFALAASTAKRRFKN